MSSETTPQRLQTAPVPAAGSPALDLDEIQGDVLIGLQKNFERFIFFEIKNVKAFKYALRHQIAPRITTTRTVHHRELELQEHKKQGDHSLLHLVGLNLGFTNNGILKLAPGADLVDQSFKDGAKKKAASLGDAHDNADPLKLTNWLPEFLSDTIDGVVRMELTSARVIPERTLTQPSWKLHRRKALILAELCAPAFLSETK